jgi:hypothetical protein
MVQAVDAAVQSGRVASAAAEYAATLAFRGEGPQGSRQRLLNFAEAFASLLKRIET